MIALDVLGEWDEREWVGNVEWDDYWSVGALCPTDSFVGGFEKSTV